MELALARTCAITFLTVQLTIAWIAPSLSAAPLQVDLSANDFGTGASPTQPGWFSLDLEDAATSKLSESFSGVDPNTALLTLSSLHRDLIAAVGGPFTIPLQGLASNRSQLRFDLDGRGALAATRTLAHLAFGSVSNAASAVVPLLLRDLVANSASSLTITNGAAVDGEVIVVKHDAILTTRQTPRGTIKLFGRPGGLYRIEGATVLGSGAVWEIIEKFTLDGRTRAFS